MVKKENNIIQNLSQNQNLPLVLILIAIVRVAQDQDLKARKMMKKMKKHYMDQIMIQEMMICDLN